MVNSMSVSLICALPPMLRKALAKQYVQVRVTNATGKSEADGEIADDIEGQSCVYSLQCITRAF